MSEAKETVYSVKDLMTVPSRSLYDLAARIRWVTTTSFTIQRRHAGLPAIANEGAGQRVLHEEALLHVIIEELVESSTHGVYRPPGTLIHLLGVALTCKDWFYPAISALWGTFHHLPALIQLLIPDHLHGVYDTPKTQYKYIWKTYCANPNHGRLHPRFLKFRFYVGCIHTLYMSGTDVATPVFSQLARLYDADILLPILQKIVWSDKRVHIPDSALRTFALVSRAPLLSSVSIEAFNPSLQADVKERIQKQLCGLLERAGNYTPELTALTVIGPDNVAIPIMSLAPFSMLVDLDIQVDLDVPLAWALPSPAEANANANGGHVIKMLFLYWSISTTPVSLLHVASFSLLTTLTVHADDHPPVAFLEQITQLGKYITPSLVHLRIVAGVHLPIAIEGVDFKDLIEPFLGCSLLEDATFELPSFSMAFLVTDLRSMLHAWPRLISLEITFSLSDAYGLPDLREIVRRAPRLCPNLIVLHLPAIATYASVGRHFKMRVPSQPPQLYFSSELVFLEHHPLDVAYHLMKVFVGRNPINPKFIPGTYWTSVDTLVEAIMNRDRPMVVRFGLAEWWFPWGSIRSRVQNVCLKELERPANAGTVSDDEVWSDDESGEESEADDESGEESESDDE